MSLKTVSLNVLKIMCYVFLSLFLFYGLIRSVAGESFFLLPAFYVCGLAPRYSEVMEIPVEHGGKTVPCKLYRRSGAPFLLLGPYPFLKEQSDFFFIARDRVFGRALDEKSDDWTRIFKWVWIAQDLDPGGEDSIVPHYRFDTEHAEDPATGLVHFTCSVNSSGEEETFRFSIPKHLIDALPEYREKAEK